MTSFRFLALATLATFLGVLAGLGLVLVAEGQGTEVDAGQPLALSGDRVFVHARHPTSCTVRSAVTSEAVEAVEVVEVVEVGSSGTRRRYGLDGEYVTPDGAAELECDGRATVITSPGLAVAFAGRQWLALAPFVMLFLILVSLTSAFRRSRDRTPPVGPGVASLPPTSSTPYATPGPAAGADALDAGPAGLAGVPVLAEGTLRVSWPAWGWTGSRTYDVAGTSGARAFLEPAAGADGTSLGGLLRGRGSHAGRVVEVATTVDVVDRDGPGGPSPDEPVFLEPVPDELRTDGSGEPGRRVWGRFEKAPGSGSSFVVRVVEADGSVLGTAVADGGLVAPFPEVVLVLGSGEPAGTLVGRADREYVDASGRTRGTVRWSAPEVALPLPEELVVRIDLDPAVPTAVRVLVLAAWFGLEAVRTG